MANPSSHLEQIVTKKNSTCNMQIVFVDIVSYSKRNSHAQVDVINAFRLCMEAALAETGQHFETPLNKAGLTLRDDVILVPAGDGGAVGFSFDGLHDTHLVFATKLLQAIGVRSAMADCARFRRQDWCDCHDAMKVRIGVSEGKVIVYTDINGNFNIAGTTVNLAARVMSVADPNEILFSDEAYQQFKDMTRGTAGYFVGYKGVVVKHGLELTVYQYTNKQLKYLNSTRNQTRGVPLPGPSGKPLPDQKIAAGGAGAVATKVSRGARSARVVSGNPACKEMALRFVEISPGLHSKVGEKPRAPTRITRPFQIDRFPMTQAIYRMVMGQCDSQFKGDNLPVDSVNWLEAVTFCNALSKLCGREEVYSISPKDVAINYGAFGFRLPTEAEWEYACGDGGLKADDSALNSVAWYSSNSKQTQNVGQLKPNDRGLFDMLGNVWEWCNDWYAKIDPNETRVDPVGPPKGLERVLRGGSWNDLANSISATYRSRRDPSQHFFNVGFRVVVTNK